jgi:putative NIF3 family GTP cyclohydrolase 1 type 2
MIMVPIRDVIAYVEQSSTHPLHSDEGLQVGDPDMQIQSILACWMATKNALERAAEVRADLVLSHESLYYPYDALVRQDNPEGWQDWPVNRYRRQLLEKHRLSFLRLHGSMDQICIFDQFRRQLRLPVAAFQGSAYYIQRYDIEPRTLDEFTRHVKSCVGMDHVRVAAPKGMAQRVSKIGLVWGGVGLFVNVAAQAELQKLGCDCLVAGESDDYGFRFSCEVGIPIIETSHEISEQAGIEYFCQRLRDRFPGLPVHMYQNRCPWEWA